MAKKRGSKKDKVVLAYSGGLDTTVIIPWLKENYDFDVIAVCVDVGQTADWKTIKERALKTGATACYVVDAQEEYIEEYLWPALKGGAKYEDAYLLGTSTARPLIGKILVEYARQEKAVAICHGATGKGNDQVRFELAIKAFAPDLRVIAAWRDDKWNLQSREDEITYLEKRGIALPMKKSSSYSCDDNIWHISHEGLELEKTENEANWNNMLQITKTPEAAPNKAQYVTIEFEKGVPVSVNGIKMNSLLIMKTVNELAGMHGIGLIDMVENRCVGMKSRGVYETPGGTLLYFAHETLEHLCLDKETYHFKQHVALKFSELIYNGLWFTQLTDAIKAFNDSVSEVVSGWVKIKLYKGTMQVAGSSSPNSLYNESIASFATGDLYNHKDAAGFIKLFGLPIEVRALMEQKNKKGQAAKKNSSLKKRPTE